MTAWSGRLALLGAAMTLGAAVCQADEPAGAEPVAAQAAPGRTWALKLPKDGKLVFSGALDYDGASVGTNSMLYPAPNAAAFFAAVITHGLIVESQKNSQRKKAQELADKVLDPYQSLLSTFSYRELAGPWLEDAQPGSSRKVVGDGEPAGSDDWLIESAPVFLMAQDQRTLILDTLVSIRAPGSAENSARPRRIRVISPAEEGADPAAAWTADEGRKLRRVSAWLFSESVDIAMRTAVDAKNDTPFRTIRYMEGAAEKMERAQLLSERCGRWVIRTLRGSLMSVPVKASTSSGGAATDPTCAKG